MGGKYAVKLLSALLGSMSPPNKSEEPEYVSSSPGVTAPASAAEMAGRPLAALSEFRRSRARVFILTDATTGTLLPIQFFWASVPSTKPVPKMSLSMIMFGVTLDCTGMVDTLNQSTANSTANIIIFL